MTKTISRTLKVTKVNYSIITMENGQAKTVKAEPITLLGEYTRAQARNYFAEKQPELLIYIDSAETKENVYEMPLEQFVKLASIVPEKTAINVKPTTPEVK